MNAVAIVETYVVLELRIRIRSLEDSNGITAASKDVQQIRILTAHLRRASGQNRDTLNKIKDSNDQQDVNAKELHDKIEDMDKRIEESQKELSESLGQLNKRIKEQRDLASDETDVQQWMNLQVEVEEEDDELENLKSSQEQVQKSLRDSQQVLEGLLLIRELSNWKTR